jgi:hypothetical protein
VEELMLLLLLHFSTTKAGELFIFTCFLLLLKLFQLLLLLPLLLL